MIKVVISGARGKMGKAITQLIKTHDDMKAIAGFDIAYEEGDKNASLKSAKPRM